MEYTYLNLQHDWPLHPVHEIAAWSGDVDDESPLCGLDKDNPHVWGYRTVYTNHVTCPSCIAIRARWTELQDTEVYADGYCSTCGAIALYGADYCENHIPAPPRQPHDA